jgi:hypothetical protein
MKILLQWLVEHAWIFYVVCSIGALIYLVRALVAQRERNLALFTLEHETATARAVRAWVTVFVFIALALLIFIGVTFALPRLPAYNPNMPLPTSTPSSGVKPPTPTPTLAATRAITLPTPASLTETPPLPTLPPDLTTRSTAEPTDTPTPMPAGVASGQMNVTFGDFGQLTGYQLSSTQVVAGQPLVATLYWQGLEGTSPTNYTVFTHLLSPDGTLLAQHDAPPAGGNEPTSEWEAGRTIEDTHQMAFGSEAQGYSGPATIAVGLYDPGDVGARVMTSEGQDQVSLPVTINVVQQ